jgi:hypothetical protein
VKVSPFRLFGGAQNWFAPRNFSGLDYIKTIKRLRVQVLSEFFFLFVPRSAESSPSEGLRALERGNGSRPEPERQRKSVQRSVSSGSALVRRDETRREEMLLPFRPSKIAD